MTTAEVRAAAQRAAALFCGAGLIALVNLFLAGAEPAARLTFVLLGGLDLATALAVWLLPWERWHPRALLALVPVTFGVVALFEAAGGLSSYTYPSFFFVFSIWLGLSQPPLTALSLSPATTAAYLLPLQASARGVESVESATVVVPLCVFVSEVTAWSVRRLKAAQAEADHNAQLLRTVVRAARGMSTLDPEAVSDSVVDALVDVGFDGAVLSLVEVDEGGFRTVQSRNFPEAFTRGRDLAALLDLAARALRARQTVVLTAARRGGAVPGFEAAGFRHLAAVPVLVDGVFGAVLTVGSARRRRLGAHELEALELLGTHAGGALANARRFQAEHQTTETLAKASMTDELTGLGNRRYASFLLKEMRPGDGLLLIDLDHFKGVNDRDGHAAGDAVLAALGRFLHETLRIGDSAARLGGEEFLVVMPQAQDAAQAAAARLVEAWRETRPRTTMSVGVALHEVGRSPLETLEGADAALYRAKAGGRDRVCAEGEQSVTSEPRGTGRYLN